MDIDCITAQAAVGRGIGKVKAPAYIIITGVRPVDNWLACFLLLFACPEPCGFMRNANNDQMLELRRRMNSSPIYERLNTEDEIDDIPYLDETSNRIVSRTPRSDSKFCAKFIFFFALSGVIFLSSISHLLRTQSLYVKVGSKSEVDKLDMADTVSEASVVYIGVMVLAAFSYFSSGNPQIDNEQMQRNE